MDFTNLESMLMSINDRW